jgi:hypothetical protein
LTSLSKVIQPTFDPIIASHLKKFHTKVFETFSTLFSNICPKATTFPNASINHIYNRQNHQYFSILSGNDIEQNH